MRYNKTIVLSNGIECRLRSGAENDDQLVVDSFNLIYSETDYLLTYPDENSSNAEQESQPLEEKAESEKEIELLAIAGSVIVGTVGIEVIGVRHKVRHRAEFGTNVVKEYRGLGIGRALLASCIECVKTAGYSQLRPRVAAENKETVSMCKRVGFAECGGNPRGFHPCIVGFQGAISMRLEL